MSDEPRAPEPRKPRPPGKKRGAKTPAPARRRAAAGPRRKPAAGFLARHGRAAAFAAGAMLLTASLLIAALYLGYGKTRGPGEPGSFVAIDWPAGIDADAAGELLARHGLVRSASGMTVFLRATGAMEGFVAGPHLLPQRSTPEALCALLRRSPDRPTVRATLPEGLTRFGIAARLEKLGVASQRAFLDATEDRALLEAMGVDPPGESRVESAEGYLFPATYDVPLDADPRGLVQRLVAEGDRRWKAALASREDGLASLRAALGWGRHEVMILASIIEKEAQVDEERPLIASVFLNRLLDPTFRPKRLQSDPTAAYGCLAWPDEAPSCAGFQGKPTPAVNLDPKNRYSTYARAGLPPGPIASPGDRSIEAVLAPAATRFFYFVAAGRGRHTFSESLGAHNDAVRKLREATTP